MTKNALVILPSYNESQNICALIDDILKQGDSFEVLVVDDNSPDGTPLVINKHYELMNPSLKSRAHLIVREKKDGRGGAVRRGLEWGLAEGRFDSLIEMDCDFSHPPADLKRGVEMLNDCDVVIGARYPGGKIVGWPLSRRVLSFCANLLARTMISFSVSDYTNGYRFYSKKAAQYLCTHKQKYKGYIYLSEVLSHLLLAGFRIKTFPIVFVNRVRGESNMGFQEIKDALTAIFQIGWKHRFGKNP